ncbi:MAG: hypothetical protein GEV05_02490 [Betaproteobacteria bacterium]|nr:hypothetical protein [Betaproteobacteria bacterium]
MPDFLPCGAPPGLGCPPCGALGLRRPPPPGPPPPGPPGCGAPSRLPGASMISSSISSSHCASVRWRSGIASKACSRWRGDMGCCSLMAALSHLSATSACECYRRMGFAGCSNTKSRTAAWRCALRPPEQCAM